MISPVFYTDDRKFAFQKVGDYYRVYDENGDFDREFRSFKTMCEYICGHRL